MSHRFIEFFTRRFIKSFIYGFLKRRDYKSIKTYCMFIGYQRSGHSLIGALIDAHPETSMGMEVDILNLVDLGYNKNQIFYCLANNSVIFKKVLKNIWTGYDYSVPNQYQGRHMNLKVIGDKKGGKSTLRLGENLDLYINLGKTVGCKIKLLHIIRNPFDNISSMIIKNIKDNTSPSKNDFLIRLNKYFIKAEINLRLLNRKDMDILTIYHEDFIKNPEKHLIQILNFLGLSVNDNYIKDCASIVYKSPHKSRYEIDWPEDLIKMVQEKINKNTFLKRYSYYD